MNKHPVLIFILLLPIISCKKSNNQLDYPVLSDTSYIQNDIIRENKTKFVSIDKTLIKLEQKEDLSTTDYQIICEFLINNNNESKSEEIGYLLFDYLQKNEKRNQEFSFFLSRHDSRFKENILCNLIQIMCIDLGD